MKKYILISVIIILSILILFIAVASRYNFSDFTEDGTADYSFLFEGGNQNRVMRNHKLVIDSGAVDFKYNSDYVVFLADTTYSMKPYEVNKSKLVYYIHDVKKDTLSKPLTYTSFKIFIKNNKIDNDLDISKY